LRLLRVADAQLTIQYRLHRPVIIYSREVWGTHVGVFPKPPILFGNAQLFAHFIKYATYLIFSW
jgi:hypothetical protein